MGREYEYNLSGIKKRPAANVAQTVGNGTSRAAVRNALQPDVQDILFEMIAANPKNRKTMEGIIELADSIAREGLLHPLVVVPAAAGYMLISGERRYHAIAELRKRTPELKEAFRTVKCSVLESGDDLKQEIQLVAANTSARRLTNIEYRNAVSEVERAFSAMLERGDRLSGTVQEMTASVFGVSTRQIRSIKAINDKLLPELRDACDNGTISLKAAAKTAMLEDSSQKTLLMLFKESGRITEKDIENQKLIEECRINEAEGGTKGKKENAPNDESRMDSALNRLERSMLNLAQKAKKNELTEDDRIRVSHVVQALTDICNDADIDIKALINSLKRDEKPSPEKSESEEGAEEG